MKTKRIDQYICIDVDKIIIDEMNELMDDSHLENILFPEDKKYWEEVAAAAKIVKSAYEVQGD